MGSKRGLSCFRIVFGQFPGQSRPTWGRPDSCNNAQFNHMLHHHLVLTWLKQNVPMQGGRDKLGWIRQLVRYTETHPIYIADNASSAVKVLKDGSIQKTVFPSLKPNRREDALLLQQWLADMMAQLTANAPQELSDQVICAHFYVVYCNSVVCSAANATTVQMLKILVTCLIH